MLRKALATLPPTLDQTYERILSTISEDESEYAFRILQWLAFAVRPLSVEEVAEVVAIDVTRVSAFDRDEVLEDPLEVLNICSGLVTMSTNSDDREGQSTRQIITLAHYSVQEYLLSDRIRQSKARKYSMQYSACQDIIARGCLMYILQFQGAETRPKEVLQRFMLADYCATFWNHHWYSAQKTEERGQKTTQIAMNLFSLDNPAYLVWVQLIHPEEFCLEPDSQVAVEDVPTPLYYASLMGLTTVVKLLLDQDANVNAQGGRYSNALQGASAQGFKEIVQLLLDNGADVNAQGGLFFNALQAATLCGHHQIVQLLLDNGADVNAQGGYYGNSLEAALYRGYKDIAQLLLDNGADVNAKGMRHGSTLEAASFGGVKETVKLLLDRKAHIPVSTEDGWTPLNLAASRGHVDIVKMLLEAGAYVAANGMDPQYGTITNLLAFNGLTDLLRFCRRKFHADLSLVGLHGETALQFAARGGHIDTFEYLLKQGQDPTILDRKGDSLLCYAASGGSLSVLKAVLQMDIKSLPKSEHWTPLHWACRAGNPEVVELLLEEGLRSESVTITQPDGERSQWSPLAIAIFHGNTEMLDKLCGSYESLQSTESNIAHLYGYYHDGSICDGCLHVSMCHSI